jgi:hypothetical protein
MKNGTKVSWANADGTHATRVYGVLILDGDPALVAPDSLTKVAPAYAVAASRVVERKDGESEQEHEARIRSEAAEREIAATKAEAAKRTKEAKAAKAKE